MGIVVNKTEIKKKIRDFIKKFGPDVRIDIIIHWTSGNEVTADIGNELTGSEFETVELAETEENKTDEKAFEKQQEMKKIIKKILKEMKLNIEIYY